jgi:hypothetical protein
MEVSDQLHAPVTLPQGKSPGTHWRGSWMGPREGLGVVAMRKIPCPCLEFNPGCPACSQVIILTELPQLCQLQVYHVTIWIKKEKLKDS